MNRNEAVEFVRASRRACAACVVAALTMTFALLLFAGSAHAATKTYEAVNSVDAAGYTVVGAKGTYITQVKKAVDRVNEIRKEACDEGIAGLTSSDYVAIQWSYDMEQIARVRAAEASTGVSHTRPNGLSCFSVESENGSSSWGECLAWNYSGVMVGIEQWYAEKDDLVNNTGGETGHYEALISPDYASFAVVGFKSDSGIWPYAVCGEFDGGTSSTASMAANENVVQKMQVKTSDLEGTLTGSSKLAVDKTAKYSLAADLVRSDVDYYNESGPYVLYAATTWTSSAPGTASVSNGTLVAKKAGIVTLSAKNALGLSAKKTVKICPATPAIKSLKAGKRCFTVKAAKQQGDITGFQVKYRSGKGAWKTKTYKAASLNKKIGKLSKGKKYQVKIRAYKSVGKTTLYSSWSSVKKVKVK